MGTKYVFSEEDCTEWKAFPGVNPRTNRYVSSRGRNGVLRQLGSQCTEYNKKQVPKPSKPPKPPKPSNQSNQSNQSKPLKPSNQSNQSKPSKQSKQSKQSKPFNIFPWPFNLTKSTEPTEPSEPSEPTEPPIMPSTNSQTLQAVPAVQDIGVVEAMFRKLHPVDKSKLCSGVHQPRPPQQPQVAARRPRRTTHVQVPQAPINSSEAFASDALEVFTHIYEHVLGEKESAQIEFTATVDLSAMIQMGTLATLLDAIDRILMGQQKPMPPPNSNASIVAMIRQSQVKSFSLSLIVSFDSATITARTVASNFMATKRDVRLYDQKTTEDEQGAQQASTAYVMFMELVGLATLEGGEIKTTVHNASKEEVEDEIIEHLAGIIERNPIGVPRR
jgi:hypothetical protein